MGNFFAWLDGKKTAIAGVVAIIAIFLSEVVVGIWGLSALFSLPLANIISTLNWFAMILGGAGMAHKGMKAATK